MPFKSVFLTILPIVLFSQGYAQDNPIPLGLLKYTRMYYSLDEALANPNNVYMLNIDITDPEQKKMIDLPQSLSNLHNLQLLSLRRHQLDSLNNAILELKNLEVLKLDGNKFKDFPVIICKISKLKVLTLKLNQIDSLPNEISALKNLKVLNLANNNFKKLPPAICTLEKLEVLNLANNPIPDSIKCQIAKTLPGIEIIF